MSIESCMHATDLDLDGSWLREWESLPPGLDEGSPHEHPGLDEGSPHDHASADREHMLQKRMSGALMVPWPHAAMTRELSHSVDRIAVD